MARPEKRMSPAMKKRMRRRAEVVKQSAINIARLTLQTVIVLCVASLTAVGAHAGYVAAKERDYFDVKKITIEGLRTLSPADVENLIGPVLGRNTFELDLPTLGQRIEAHRRIKRVLIRRALPEQLIVTIKERETAAVVKNKNDKGAIWYVDREGVFLDPVAPGDAWSLPFVAGVSSATGKVDKTRLAAAFIAIDNLGGYRLLGQSALSGVTVSDGGVLTLYFDGSETVALAPAIPWGDEAARLKTVDAILRKKGMTVKTINLLFADRVIVTGAQTKKNA